ncbi:FMN-dependent 2-nitropropane dioxygenase [Lasiosphaeria miniovina]|uniref:FMN-dependent 2-nitropropane dioxygenase n=1 Tax=Lasiosphaeria miniovina TaxID=1954250 RepID=A0AA40E9G7_9PEZI|nr:FMN-dependent 2-nitropropane dioxygenase [Lasiosphaeria miniovina]KAK0733279.1 FMN-dependent 2-nitropropane dioxygenase [Lasiosphaeria miniovina]
MMAQVGKPKEIQARGKNGPVKNMLKEWFPKAQSPFIISAPMLGVANGSLAAEVSKAGGIGMVPGGLDFNPGSAQLVALGAELTKAREILGLVDQPREPLPVGVGFILCHESLTQFEETALPILKEHLPRAVWLFAPPADAEDGLVRGIIAALHASGFVVIFQVGNVAAARQAALDGADVIVAQGIDAGGHQFVRGSGVVTLVPEVMSMLEDEFSDREIVLVAAGGIVDGRSVAAALALGAEAAVMGTKFIVAPEAWTPDARRKLILETKDGGVSTAKSSFYDQFQNSTVWGELYDGRAIIGDPYLDHVAGLPLEESQRRFLEARDTGDVSQLITWVGAGVGLVKDAKPAADIVNEVREEAKQRVRYLARASSDF